jgi:hypothetical protein
MNDISMSLLFRYFISRIADVEGGLTLEENEAKVAEICTP